MVVKCNNGHWYDSNVDLVCPHCKREQGKLALKLNDREEDDKTVSFQDIAGELEDLDKQISASATSAKQVDIGEFDFDLADMDELDDDKTIALGFFGVSEEIQPVVGWLICIQGEERGKDYRLHSGKNFIGRSPKMDVAVVKDMAISREKHASIVYDPKGNGFYLAAEEANLVYINEELIQSARPLQENDKVRVGETEFVFVPYCKEERKWQEE